METLGITQLLNLIIWIGCAGFFITGNLMNGDRERRTLGAMYRWSSCTVFAIWIIILGTIETVKLVGCFGLYLYKLFF